MPLKDLQDIIDSSIMTRFFAIGRWSFLHFTLFSGYRDSFMEAETWHGFGILQVPQIRTPQTPSAFARKHFSKQKESFSEDLPERVDPQHCPRGRPWPQLVLGAQSGLHLHLLPHPPLPQEAQGGHKVPPHPEGGLDTGWSSSIFRIWAVGQQDPVIPDHPSSIRKSGLCLQK